MEYTPGKWEVIKWGGVVDIEAHNSNKKCPKLRVHIARVPDKANANRIVKAVNCHDDLVEALKRVQLYLALADKRTFLPNHTTVSATIEQALAEAL